MPMIRTEISDHIALITMDSPPVNAVNQQFMEEMIAAIDRLNDLDDVRVAVITGAGKCFSAGADIKGRLSQKEEPGSYWAHARRAREMSWSMIECKKPLIAAINDPGPRCRPRHRGLLRHPDGRGYRARRPAGG